MAAALFVLHGTAPSRESETRWTMLINSAWSWWVYVDRRRHRLGYPFEFDALVFFAWPLVAPYYLLRSRASRSRLATLLIWLLYALPFLVAGTCYVLAGLPQGS
jgi:hypothetical protein